jgi:hypothetical protein
VRIAEEARDSVGDGRIKTGLLQDRSSAFYTAAFQLSSLVELRPSPKIE